MSEISLEFTSGLEFEFVIVISICDSNLLKHVKEKKRRKKEEEKKKKKKKKKKKSSLELLFTGMIIQITNFLLVCKPSKCFYRTLRLINAKVIPPCKAPGGGGGGGHSNDFFFFFFLTGVCLTKP